MRISKLLTTFKLDGAIFAVVLLAYAIMIDRLQGFSFRTDGVPNFLEISFAFAPVVVFYLLLRLLSSAWVAASFTLFVSLAISIANAWKMAATGEPLSFNDLASGENISIVFKYLMGWQLWLVAMAVTTILIWMLLTVVKTAKAHPVRFTSIVVLASALVGGVEASTTNLSDATNSLLTEAGINYVYWSWPENVTRNGVLTHLIQSSKRKLPPHPDREEARLFENMKRTYDPFRSRPRTVITILCESCWYDETHFKSVFSPLEKQMTALRAVSPVYGGGTVNTAFEVATGLPSESGVLTGIIYQEYEALMRDKIEALPNYMKALGYNTIALHNNSKSFWLRDLVLPKMGFDRFLGIEDMPGVVSGYWAEDKVLFDTALKELKNNNGNPIFMGLTTVFTHGSYRSEGGDHGERDYATRLTKTIDQMAEFVREVTQIDPNALILIYGDHKPSLNKYFLDSGVLATADFETTGENELDFRLRDEPDRKKIGDVPVFVRWSQDNDKVAAFVREANRMPFFCLSEAFDRNFLKSGMSTFAMTQNACRAYKSIGYQATTKLFPGWIFAETVLDQKYLKRDQ